MTVQNLDPFAITKRLGGGKLWFPPREFGPDGFSWDHRIEDKRIIITIGPTSAISEDILHASVSRRGEMPTYADLVQLHYGAWGSEGWAYQVFAPQNDHVNIHMYALHLWGNPDGSPLLPNYGEGGSI